MNDNWKPADGLLGQIDASKRDCAAIERVLTTPGAAEPVAPFGYMRPADIEAIRSNRGGEWCQAFGVTPVNCWRDGAGDRIPIYTAPPTTSQAGRDALDAVTAERDRLHALINSPETRDFLVGIRNEVAHQVERWGAVHERAKEPADWFWLVGYLAGKALAAHKEGDTEKALHHCISTAAVLANWHTHILLGSPMPPGSSDLQAFLVETFGANFVEYQSDRAALAGTPGAPREQQP